MTQPAHPWLIQTISEFFTLKVSIPSQLKIQISFLNFKRKSKHFHALLDITYGWYLNDESSSLWNSFYSHIYVQNNTLVGYNKYNQMPTLFTLEIKHIFFPLVNLWLRNASLPQVQNNKHQFLESIGQL